MNILRPQQTTRAGLSQADLEAQKALQDRRRALGIKPPAPTESGGSCDPKNNVISFAGAVSRLKQSLRTPKVGDHVIQRTPDPKHIVKRWWLRVYMAARDLDVQQILARWRRDKQQTTKLAAAIRLYDALERADLDAVRREFPWIADALAAPKNARRSPPSYRSISNNKEEERGEVLSAEQIDARKTEVAERAAIDEMGQTTLDATGGDWRTDTRVRNQIKKWAKTGYVPAHIKAARLWWQDQDWRGKKGDPFMFNNLCEIIGGMLKYDVENMDLDMEEVSPYLAHEYWRKGKHEDAAPDQAGGQEGKESYAVAYERILRVIVEKAKGEQQ
jgi:hypothetical protein